MQRIRFLYLLVLFSLLLTSCQAGSVTTNLEAPVLSFVFNDMTSNPSIENSNVQLQSNAALEESECFKCHSDKDKLIETADPVTAPAESESSGVG